MITGLLVYHEDGSWVFINEHEKQGLWLDTEDESEAKRMLESDGWIYNWSHPDKPEHHYYKNR